MTVDMDKFDEYLSGDVPQYLQYLAELPTYQDIDVQDTTSASTQNYQRYFSDLNTDGLMFENGSRSKRSATAKYYNSHHVLEPLGGLANDEMGPTPSRSKYTSFVNVPMLLSNSIVHGITYHTAVKMGADVYIFGGLAGRSREGYAAYLQELTKNFTIPPSNVIVKLDYDLPPPLMPEKLKSLAFTPNHIVYKYSTDSNSLIQLLDMDGLTVPTGVGVASPDVGAESVKEVRKSVEFTRKFGNDSPINEIFSASDVRKFGPSRLLCSAAKPISEGHFCTYGGFELQTTVTYPDDNHVVLERKIVLPQNLFIFDAALVRFRPLRMSVHPAFSASLPTAIPRFGLSAVCTTYNDELKDRKAGNHRGKSALVLTMGGYRLHSDNRSFVALNDIWKCEIFWSNNNYSDQVICYPVGCFNVIGGSNYLFDKSGGILPHETSSSDFTGLLEHEPVAQWPKPRGFFSMSIWDNMKSGADPPSYFAHESVVGKSLIVFGGSSTMSYKVQGGSSYMKTDVLGDMWRFDFDTGKWSQLHYHNHDGQEVLLPICGQASSMNSYNMLFVGGLHKKSLPDELFMLKPIAGDQPEDRKLVERFISSQPTPSKTTDLISLQLPLPSDPSSRGMGTSFVIDLEKLSISPVDYTFVKRGFGEGSADFEIVLTALQLIQLDSKLLCIGGDVQLIDSKTKKKLPESCQVAGCMNVGEVYTAFLKL